MYHIFLAVYISFFGSVEVYDVAEWKATTTEEIHIALSECQELTEQADNVLQCELHIDGK
jgi:hypothetical protein